MEQKVFKLKSDYKPEGDQPKAISELLKGLKKGMRKQTLLGATGTERKHSPVLSMILLR